MDCLEKYRSKLVAEINRNLRMVLLRPDVAPVHDFRVGVKRLTALYHFLQEIDADLKAKRILRPCRSLFKPIGRLRDMQIAVQLIESLDQIDGEDSKILLKTLHNKIRRDYRAFQTRERSNSATSIRMPTIRSSGISASAIHRHKPEVLHQLLQQVFTGPRRMNAEQWHRKRILLKRYHHKVDAFTYCPGHKADEDVLKQIRILEQLLGDWHDRVISIDILQSFDGLELAAAPAIAAMQRQEKLLLGSAKIYLDKFRRWYQAR